ncbi:hypothetical protein [Janthinobacterium sp. ZB1P44]|uniref:hypothetical protein n=1 Tax=Janthinobacterium sp. ZB1P44 TaxID=3424192 RepID=UPI003F269870
MRASQTVTQTKHMVVGVEGGLGAWNFESGLTWSQNSIDERYTGGYATNQGCNDILANPDFDAFALGQKAIRASAIRRLRAYRIDHDARHRHARFA